MKLIDQYNYDNLINVIEGDNNLMTGDLIYFYNMMPSINDVIYFNKSIELEKPIYLKQKIQTSYIFDIKNQRFNY